MNADQLSDFFYEVALAGAAIPKKVADQREENHLKKKFLNKFAPSSLWAASYIASNYTDVDLIQTTIAQILSLYYKSGVLRLYALQFVPGFVSLYLLALSKKQHKSVSLFETFLVAIYNEEIIENAETNEKKVEDIRIPSIRHHSVYHDPVKIQVQADVPIIRNVGITPVLTTLRFGPFPSVSKMNGENKFMVMNRILFSVNESLFEVASEVAARYVCLGTLSVCCSGFNFPETAFQSRVLETESHEVIEDFSRKPRQQVTGEFLDHLLRGCYLALFNGAADLALRAIDSIHLRAQYEMFPDTLLVINSLRNSLLDNMWSKKKRGELMWTRPQHKELQKHRGMVTNASLKMKRMPEDIPVQENQKETSSSRINNMIDEGMDHLHDLKKKVVNIKGGLQHKMHRRKKSVEPEENELQTIKEEKPAESSFSADSENSSPSTVVHKLLVLNGDDVERRLRDVAVIEHDYEKKVETKAVEDPTSPATPSKEKGAFTMAGLRHMDSGGSTYRSIDN
ncbi:Protein CBG10074 [Caenorhabditis briggsae]|uniref:Protein CBG10074 n=2 Tax=Caenorhabditis briggsae TaxID=6238 RepID=A8XAB6_CAEBR|nr:Protein CBG10074 [Caenorhabditis briggsae]ULU02009.1 hypothetical protein L3Y34_001936 [Caenorhabditis briggsae]CAP29584.2 Protein CBG10074 [Caenorhabditis briggsae]